MRWDWCSPHGLEDVSVLSAAMSIGKETMDRIVLLVKFSLSLSFQIQFEFPGQIILARRQMS